MMVGRDWNVVEDRKSVAESQHHPWLRLFAVFIVVIVLVVAVAVPSGVIWLKRAMRESLPQLDGELRLPGLSTSVSVLRDAHGVPHIQAANLDDLFVAQGYVTAQDRLWQMDMARRMAAGEAAEILGARLLPHDRMQRILLFRATAERMAASLSDRDRRFMEDYARGVNAYIDAHSDRLPAEFRLLLYKPRPWQPVDSILVGLMMVQILDEHWPEKLDREQVTARLGPTLTADLYPTGSWRDHPPTTPPPDLTTPPIGPIPDVPLDESQSSSQDLLHLRQLTSAHADCAECTPGSNEWVVSGAHTASGKPILSNDMHLGHDIPNIWYEVDLQATGFHVAGVTVPGLPFVTAGHNEHIAWGYTALYGDTQDVYVEQTNSQGEYQTPTGWHPIEHEREVIRVRGGQEEIVDVEHTAHGPVISPLAPHERRVLTLRWSAYDPKASGIPLFDLDSAGNFAEFRIALTNWWGPTLNLVYADDQGHIGYQAVGFIPNRPTGLSGMPISDTQHEWQGFIPFDQLPSTLDPSNGVIATANSRITPDGYSTPLTLEWAAPYRNERIWKWLAGREKLTSADMLTLQTDIYSEVDQELAQRLAYAIDHSSNPNPRLRTAADLLRSWDGVLSVDSAPAAIVVAAKSAFWSMLLKPRIGDDWQLYEWAESSFAAEEIIMHAPPQWLPHEYTDWDDFLTAILTRGLDQAHAPFDLKSWRYGTAHPVEIAHPLYGMLPLFKRWTGTGAQPQSGDQTTVKQVSRTFGPSQRFTIDWSNVDAATENIVMGESGNPLSAYYRDHWPYWYNGKTFALPFSAQAVGDSAQHTLRLLP
jgi:penicillin amidase